MENQINPTPELISQPSGKKKWAVISVLAVVALGVLAYFLTTSGLFKGMLNVVGKQQLESYFEVQWPTRKMAGKFLAGTETLLKLRPNRVSGQNVIALLYVDGPEYGYFQKMPSTTPFKANSKINRNGGSSNSSSSSVDNSTEEKTTVTSPQGNSTVEDPKEAIKKAQEEVTKQCTEKTLEQIEFFKANEEKSNVISMEEPLTPEEIIQMENCRNAQDALAELERKAGSLEEVKPSTTIPGVTNMIKSTSLTIGLASVLDSRLLAVQAGKAARLTPQAIGELVSTMKKGRALPLKKLDADYIQALVNYNQSGSTVILLPGEIVKFTAGTMPNATKGVHIKLFTENPFKKTWQVNFNIDDPATVPLN